MARPTKSVNVLTDYSQTKGELAFRKHQEDILRGEGEIEMPDYLTDKQQTIFQHIVGTMENSGILGSLDVYVLTECVIAIDRMQAIEEMVNSDPQLIFDTKLMATKERYTKAFCRYTNELSLSPQSRAKLANINLDRKQKAQDPTLNVLESRRNAE